jgi:hypothetical protein
MDSSEFFGSDPAPRARGLDDDKNGYGQYLLDVDGRGKKAYSRATTIAKMLDNTNGLEIWTQRKIAKGVAQSPALTARAAIAPLDDKQVWKEIVDQADVLSGGNEKRNLGSAFHELHERVPNMTNEEYAAIHPDLRVTYERYRAELDRLGITEVLTEGTCANTAIGTAGKFDAVFRLPDGRLVIGDRKSGRITEYPHSAAVQLAVYANADVLIEFNEDGSTERLPMPAVDKSTAIVVDVTIGNEQTAAVHVYEIDIWAGWAAALLSAKVRRWRNRRDLVTPYHPEFPPADRAANAAAVLTPGTGVPSGFVAGAADDIPIPEPLRATPEQRAEFAAELGYGTVAQPVEVAHGPTANAYTAPGATPHMNAIQAAADEQRARVEAKLTGGHPAFSSARQENILLDGQGNEIVPPAAGSVQDVFASDVDELLATFKTKAQMQAVLAKVDPSANLARTRANLAKDAAGHPNWPNVRTQFVTGTSAGAPVFTDPHAAEATAAIEGRATELHQAVESFSPVVSNAPGPVPADPEPGFPVVQPGGAMNPYAQAAPPPAPVAEPLEDQLLRRIGAATSVNDIAAVWQAANDAGIGWPARLHQAADVKSKSFTN